MLQRSTSAPRVLLSLAGLTVGLALGAVSGGCSEEDTNLPFIFVETPTRPVTGPTPIFFELRTPEGGAANIGAFYSVDGGEFLQATPAPGAPPLNDLAGSPEGLTQFFFWDPRADLQPGIYREVVFRIPGVSGDLGRGIDSGPFVVDLTDRLDATSTFPGGAVGPSLTRPLAAALPDGRVWIAGGEQGAGFGGGGSVFDPVDASFGSVSGLSQARREAGIARLNSASGGELITVGGRDPAGAPQGTIEAFRAQPNGNFSNRVLTASLLTARAAPAVASLLDGRVVVIGGDVSPSGSAPASTPQIELIDPSADAGAGRVLAALSDPLAARRAATATALPDGRVLVVGGFDDQDQPLAGGFLLDAQATTLTPVSSAIARGEQRAILLPDGEVLLVGGTTAPGSDAQASRQVELWDPVQNGLVPRAGMSRPRREFGAALVGGFAVVIGGSGDGQAAATGERYDRDLNQWVDVETPGLSRADALLVPTGPGQALVLGGNQVPELYTADAAFTTESFDALPSIPRARFDHTATDLLNGDVLVVGGTAGVDSATTICELYDRSEAVFVAAGSLRRARSLHAAERLFDGNVLVVGGRDANGPVATAELYEPLTDSWSDVGDMRTPRYGHTVTSFANNRLLIAGGVDASGQPVTSLEIWDATTRAFSDTGLSLSPRTNHDAVAVADQALIGPGFDSSGQSQSELARIESTLNAVIAFSGPPRGGSQLNQLGLSGVVVYSGGRDASGLPRADAQLIDFRLAPPRLNQNLLTLRVARSEHVGNTIAAGAVLVTGGETRFGRTDQAEVYTFSGDVTQGSFRRTADPRQLKVRARHTATPLPDSRVLIVGGIDERGVAIAGAEVFTP